VTAMSENLIITIGREFGSGGREIARKVAEKLGIKMYDKELISMIAKSSGMSEDVRHEVDETVVNSFLYAISSGAFSGTPMVSAMGSAPRSSISGTMETRNTVKYFIIKCSPVFLFSELL
jgi:cytidylate kinase